MDRGIYSKGQIAAKYFSYYIKAFHSKGHGIHSPFVYRFITDVLNDKRNFYAYNMVEEIRKQLLHNHSEVNVNDFGAGSAKMKTSRRKISDIASSSLSSLKYSRLLFRMINYYQPQNILELGTSLGVTTAYMAMANSYTNVLTIEGSEDIAAIAKNNFDTLGLTNINLVVGSFDDVLSPVVNQMQRVDFAFIDGNHRKEATLNYFEELLAAVHNDSILVFDDIHWSREMETAWDIVKKNPSVTSSIDLFFWGIIFFRNQFKEKQHFTIRF
ncbi:MAG TPA: class I SAM-dependent methyltransferase [Chitinophagaceae bacterium]|nr:class I SAM-dependent methyltransferase [Chitinophagaceae bacterium]